MWNKEQHTKWLAANRKAMLKIINEALPGEKFFCWCGTNYSLQMIGVVCEYNTGRDLTASMLEWWCCHESGDVPPFHLSDIIKAMGDLWDSSVAAIIWGEK